MVQATRGFFEWMGVGPVAPAELVLVAVHFQQLSLQLFEFCLQPKKMLDDTVVPTYSKNMQP